MSEETHHTQGYTLYTITYYSPSHKTNTYKSRERAHTHEQTLAHIFLIFVELLQPQCMPVEYVMLDGVLAYSFKLPVCMHAHTFVCVCVCVCVRAWVYCYRVSTVSATRWPRSSSAIAESTPTRNHSDASPMQSSGKFLCYS